MWKEALVVAIKKIMRLDEQRLEVGMWLTR
jgi:hypothetical protein